MTPDLYFTMLKSKDNKTGMDIDKTVSNNRERAPCVVKPHAARENSLKALSKEFFKIQPLLRLLHLKQLPR